MTMNYRCIYIVESYTNDGELVMRRFARNKRVADRIAKQCKRGVPYIRKTSKDEHSWIDHNDVEG